LEEYNIVNLYYEISLLILNKLSEIMVICDIAREKTLITSAVQISAIDFKVYNGVEALVPLLQLQAHPLHSPVP